MSRRYIIGFSACTLIAVVLLVVSGSRGFAVRTFALDAPNEFPVATLRPGSRVCEGPVTSTGQAQAVRIWGAPAGSSARLTVVVREAKPPALVASGRLTTSPTTTAATARLNRPIPGERPLKVCLLGDAGSFTLAGYPAVNPAVVMAGPLTGPQPGPEPGHEFSLVLLASRNRSLFRALPIAFARASLWRASWVGSWTFWVLTFALLATFGLGAAAVALATSADADDDEGRAASAPGPSPATDGDPPRYREPVSRETT